MAPTRSCVHYKFSSKLNYDIVTFDGLHISLCHLKCLIMGREKLKAANCDLQISNAQTNEEYTDDNALIPKNSSVIVRRIPVGGVKATSKASVMTPKSHKILETAFRNRTEPVSGTPKAIGDSSASMPLAHLAKTANLADANASEEDKIKAMMTQASHDYDPINYMKKPLGPIPPSYTCFCCGKPGHYIRNCPPKGDKNFESVPRLKKSTGIPRSFMMEVKDPNTRGVMLTNTGKYAIPAINAEAYAQGKKEKTPFLAEEPSSSFSSDGSVPYQLLCLICKDIMMDAVLIPCCGNSYCDECIRTALLESEEHTCPTCHQTDVSPDTLVANKFLRQAVNNFRNGTSYRKQIQQQQQQQHLPLPPPARPLMRQLVTCNLQPLLWPTTSRQQKPLMVPLAPLASHSAAALSLLAPGPSPVAAGLPVNPSSGIVSDLPPAASLSLPAEKPAGPFCDADTVRPPAALVIAVELSKSSSLSISSLLEEKGYQIPVLRQPALPSLLAPHRQSLPITGHPMRASRIRSAGGRPGWELCSSQGHPCSERTQRTQAPTLPAPPAVLVPVPPPALYPPLPPARPLPPGVAPPHFPPQFPPGQPPSAGYTVPPPGYPPAPATMSSPWVSTAVLTAHSNTLPRTQAPPLSREEFYREHQRLKEEEKKKSKLDEFTDDFAKELMEYKRIQKERRRSFSRSKSPCSASSYSRSLYTYSKSRSGSIHSCSSSRSLSRSHSRSSSRSPPYPRRGKGKSCKYRSRSRSHGCHRPRSPAYRRYHSRSRSPVWRGQSPAKRTLPEGEGERQYFDRYRDVPLYDTKAYYGRSVDLRDLFEKERYREWERNYREWYGKFYKGYAVGAQPPPSGNSANFSPDRFGPRETRGENLPYAWGRREDYPGGQSQRKSHGAGNYPEEPLGRESHGVKDPSKSNEKEVEYPLGDGKGNEHKKHQKRRKGDENEGFPNAELLEGTRKAKESVTAEDVKTDSLFLLPSRDDATPVRDEPMEADSIAFKPVPEKEKEEKDKPKAKIDKTKPKVDVAGPPKKGNIKNPANASQEVDMHREDSPQMEPPVKKVKRDLPKTDNVKTSSSQKDEKALGTPQKVDPKVTEDHPATRPAKEEKAKNNHPKETKSEKASNKEDKSKQPAEKSKPSDAKPGKRKVNEKVDKDHEATSIKVSKAETAESKTSPKGKTEPDGEKGERTPAKDKSAFLDNPAKKTELNQETGKKFVSGEKVPPAKEPVEEPEPSSSKVKQEKAKGNVRRKVTAPDGSSSALVDYSSTSSPGGSAVRKAEEEPDTRQTVMKTMEEDSNDIPAPAEDVIIMMQIPQSKWDKDDFESEEEDIKSTQVPANIEKPASVIKNVSAKPPNPVKHNEKETEPLEETQKTTKEASYKGCQHDAKSSRSLMSNEKGKTKDKDPSEQRKRSVQRGKDHSECATKQGNGKNISQSSKDHRSSEKHDPGRGSTAKDFPPNQDKKSDCDGNRDCPSSKCRDEKSELARGKDSPSQCRESISVQKSKRRDKRAEPSKKGTGDAKRSSYSPPCEQKQADDKAAHDSKRTLEEHKPLDKNSEDEKHVPPEVKSNEEKEPGGNKPPLRQESPDVKNEKENVTGQNDGNVVKPNPPVSSSSWLSSALTRETDEAAFVPDCSESDSESNGGGFGSKSQASKQDSNVSAKDEEAAGKHPKDPTEKAVDKVKEDTAAPAAVEQPEASRSQRQSSASVSHKACLSQSLSESQTRSHSGSAGSGESQGSKKKQKKMEKKQHKKHKWHKKRKKHIGNETELGKSQKHKHEKKKQKKRKDREKDDQKVKSVTPQNDR